MHSRIILTDVNTPTEKAALLDDLTRWAGELGFQQIGIGSLDLRQDEAHLERWLALGMHGDMAYMARHGTRRSRPDELIPGTVSVISARMDYLPAAKESWSVIRDRDAGYVSRYALGRDYHKLMRSRLAKLATRLSEVAGPIGHRVFVDSAPVLEKALARNAGLGWIGKHSNLINRRAGSWFFIGEIYTDLPLPQTGTRPADHCGSCRACIDICPTKAIVAPYQVDARRCISYLTIENRGEIPVEFRKAIGNRIYGCDDCQLVCPWNRFARLSVEKDFQPRHELDGASLSELFAWDEATFLKKTEGSAIRRTGYRGWLRNIAVALGNSQGGRHAVTALNARADHADPMIRDHVAWSRKQLEESQQPCDM